MKRKWIVIVAALSMLVLVGLMLFRHRAQEEQSQTQQTGSMPPAAPRPTPPQKPATAVKTLGSPASPTTATMEQSIPGEPAIEKRYVIRVVDGPTKVPISKAKVHVELEYGLKVRWEGSTDSQGIFAFTWRVVRESVKVRIWISAPGFLSVDAYGPLLEDKIFLMNKSS